MKFLSDILARAGLVVDGTVTLNSVANATTDTDRFIVVDSGVVKYRTGTQLLSDIGGISGNQTITLSGDATGSGATSIAVTLANSGVIAGTYGSSTAVPVITVDAKGRVTGVTTASISGSLTFTGDVTGSGTTGTTTTLTLANSGVAAGTYNNVTVNAKGLVTSGSNVSYLTSYTETDTLASVTGRGASTSTRTTFVEVGVTRNGADTVADGPWFRWTNADTSRQMLTQLNASNGLTTWAYNGATWSTAFILSQAGAGIFSSSVTATSFIRSGGTSSQFLKADGSVDSTTYQSTSQKGQANGYASLDGAGKVPIAQLPSSIMEYKGTWNASTNSPSLADGTGDTGDVYRVSTAGTRNLGSGSITFDVGDYVIYNGTIWEKSDTTDAVASVNGLTGVITLTTTNIGEGTNLYYTDARARAAITLTTTGTSGAATYSGGVLNIPQYQPAGSYLTAESDTLATVTGRGATTSTGVTFNGSVNTGGANGIELGWTGNTINDQRIGRIRPISTPTQNPYAGGLAFDYYKYSGTQYQFYEGMRLSGAGYLGLGTSSPSHKLHIIPDSSSDSIDALCIESNWGSISNHMVRFDGNVSGTGDGNVLLVRGGGTRTDTEIFEVQNGSGTQLFVRGDGKVGIGTTSVTAKLHVVANSNQDGLFVSAADSSPFTAKIATFRYAANGNDICIEAQGGKAAIQARAGASTMDLLLNAAGGYVGIGTTAPATPLHVLGGPTGTGSWNKTATLAATYPGLIFNSNGTKWGGIAYDYSAGMRFWVNASNDDIFATTNVLSILNNGNVGINSSAPTFKLEVGGTTYLNGNVSINTNYNGFALNVSGTTYVIGGHVWVQNGYGYTNSGSTATGMYPDSSHNIDFRSNNGTAIYVNSSKYVGINTTSPDRLFTIAPASGDAYINLKRPVAASTQATLEFNTAGTNDWLIRTDDASANLKFYSYGTSGYALILARSTGAATFSSSVTASSLIKSGGTSAQFLMADGSVSTNPGWITGYTETDTLATVTNRGNTTTGRINVRGIGNQSGGNILMGNTGNASNKWSYLTGAHYNADSQPQGFALIGGLSTDTTNAVVIGGNIYEANPATEIQFWTHTATTHNLGGTQRGVINSSGNWGIGALSPGQTLHVYNGNGNLGYKTARFDSNDTANGTRVLITNSGNTSNRGFALVTGGSGGVGPGADNFSIGYYNADSTFVTQNIFNITSSGFVGINTLSAYIDSNDKFVVAGGRLAVNVGAFTPAAFNRSNGGAIVDLLIGGYGKGYIGSNGTDITLVSYANLLVTATNVGIGTASPSYKLDVSGQIRVNNGVGNGSGAALFVAGSGDVTLTDGGSIFWGAYDYGASTYIRAYDNSDIMYFYLNGTNAVNFRSSGVTINTGGKSLQLGTAASNPGSGVFFAGSSTNKNWFIGNQYNVNDALEFTPSAAAGTTTIGSTPAMVITGNSYIGINLTNPQAILDVSHTAGTTNIIRVSNGSGNYRWRVDQNFSMIMTNASGTDTFSVTTAGTLTAITLIKSGGTSSQFLKADGSVDSNSYLTAESDTLSTVTNRGNTTSQTLFVDQTTGGGYVFRTSSAWGGWARHAFSIADGSNNILSTIGGYGGSGTSISFMYIGKSYTDFSAAFNPDGNVEFRYDNSTRLTVDSVGISVSGRTTSGWGQFSSSTQGTPIVKAIQEDSTTGYYLFQGVTGSTEMFRVDRSGAGYFANTITTDGNIYISNNGGRLYFDRPNGATVGSVGWHTNDVFYVAGHPDYGPGAGNAVRVYGFGSDLHFGSANAGDVITINNNGTINANYPIAATGGSGTIATLLLNRNIATPSNYYNGLQIEVRATSGTAGIGLHRNGYSHVGIYHDASNVLKFDMNGGSVTLNHNTGTIWGTGNLTNLNQLTNGPGYITSTNSDFTYAASLTLSTSWQDTGVSATNLSTSGVYLLTCALNDFGVSGGQYTETYAGIMYWYAGSTNSTNYSEIQLHHSGHADNDRYIYLRTRTDVGSSTAKIYLQIKGNGNNSGASTYTFTFKRLL